MYSKYCFQTTACFLMNTPEENYLLFLTFLLDIPTQFCRIYSHYKCKNIVRVSYSDMRLLVSRSVGKSVMHKMINKILFSNDTVLLQMIYA